jgi:hypothetical protein
LPDRLTCGDIPHPSTLTSFPEEGRNEYKDMSRLKIPIHLIAVFLCGLLVAFLDVFNRAIDYSQHTWNISAGASAALLALLLPLVVGVVAPFTVDRRDKHFISLALLTGMLALTGWYGYWFPGVVGYDDALAASCHSSNPDPSCSHGPINPETHFATSAFLFIWFVSLILVLVSSLITCLIIRSAMKRQGERVQTRG